MLRHVTSDMHALRRSGFDIVLHTFSEEDLRFYRKTMRDIVSTSRDAGLAVWLDPWGLGGIFGGEAFSEAALREPDWRQVDADGSRLPACCPSNPGFRGFAADWISAACATEAGAVFWDEPHFVSDPAGQRGCHCKHCDRIGGGSHHLVLTGFLMWAFRLVRESGKKNVLCLLPEHFSGFPKEALGSLVESGLHNIGTDPFWFLRGEDPVDAVTGFGDPVAAAARACGIESHIWIQCFKAPSGRESEITRAVVSAARLSPDVVAAWGFEGCAAMSSLACDRPDVAWQCFLQGMQTASRRG